MGSAAPECSDVQDERGPQSGPGHSGRTNERHLLKAILSLDACGLQGDRARGREATFGQVDAWSRQ
jgi:hypothetical protein